MFAANSSPIFWRVVLTVPFSGGKPLFSKSLTIPRVICFIVLQLARCSFVTGFPVAILCSTQFLSHNIFP